MASEYGENFKNKVVLVTGAASGIGAATATEFARHGANLALTDVDSTGLDKIVKKIREISSVNITTDVGDLRNLHFRENFVENVIAKHGQIDILVNSAGITDKDSASDAKMEIYDRIMDINLRVPYHLSSLCIPHLKKTRGSILNMSSTVTEFVSLGELSYSLSKAGIEQLTKHQAVELAPFGVRSNCLSPGVVLTNIHHADRDTEIAKYTKLHLVNRCAEPEEIANLIVFVSSDKGFHFTGSSIRCDGGLILKKQAS